MFYWNMVFIGLNENLIILNFMKYSGKLSPFPEFTADIWQILKIFVGILKNTKNEKSKNFIDSCS